MTKQAAHGGEGSSVGMNDGVAGENAHKNNDFPRGEGTEAVAWRAKLGIYHDRWSLCSADPTGEPGWHSVQPLYAHPAGGEAPSVVGAARRALEGAAEHILEAECFDASVPEDARYDKTNWADDDLFLAWQGIQVALAALATLQADGGSLREQEARSVPTEKAETPVVGWQPTHRHIKSGGFYRVIERAKDITNEHGEAGVEVVIYRGVGGQTWVRRASEFDDGRFEPLPPAPTDTTGEA